ncbi:MAG: DUF2298 domain-containing protein, partial [Vicinamibacterales bacterium]
DLDGFAIAHGIAGALFVTVLGNLIDAGRLIRTIADDSWSSTPFFEWFWTATRAIPHLASEAAPISEFPFFTFLYGDLHAHAMSLPFTVLVLALVLSALLPASPPGPPASASVRLGMLALALGALFPLNAWDYPTYSAIVVAGLLFGGWLRRGQGESLLRVGAMAAMQAVTVVAASRLLFWPFFERYGQAYGSFRLWHGSHTSVAAYLAIHGLFLFLISSTVAWVAAARATAVRRDHRGVAALGFAGLLAATGLLLTVLVEFVVLAGDIGRMNTVFKFYLQAWVLLSMGAATGTAVILDGWRLLCARPAWMDAAGAVWVGLACALVAAAASYPVLATRARWHDRFPSDAGFTLDGEAFMRTATHTEAGTTFALAPDLDAIRWLRSTVSGTPVIAEALLPEYRWGARISSHTGLPTILGWRVHETQQRALLPQEVISRRADDVAALYGTTDIETARAVLARYHVELVYVGPLERLLYPADGLAKFQRHPSVWQPVYDRNGVVIYRVTS